MCQSISKEKSTSLENCVLSLHLKKSQGENWKLGHFLTENFQGLKINKKNQIMYYGLDIIQFPMREVYSDFVHEVTIAYINTKN